MERYKQFEFIADMGMAYACADLVISRAGSGTVFEILALKKPALLIPLEGQTRGDQAENAAYFEQKGLCRILKQSELSSLPQAIEKTIADGGLKERLKEADFTPGNEVILREIRKLLQ
jgi:UDP-N-acetylglucosamine--N-acetylmuramyl-(pentapeptide) pyrophosphoryl-undecaprenol N-acetylglucosamine transferase